MESLVVVKTHMSDFVVHCWVTKFSCATMRNSRELRQKKSRPTELARYSFVEAEKTLRGYVVIDQEREAMEYYKSLLANTEIICAKDNCSCVLVKI